MTSRIENLYINFGILADAKGNVSEHEKEYKAILEAVKGDANEKRLAAQFIARFFKYFPNLSNEALDAQFDLCEDDDLNIRKKAIKDLAILCQENKKLSSRISDALTQLLQAEDPHELSIVQHSLLTVFQCDPKGAMLGIFNQVKNGEDSSREKGLRFISNNLASLMKPITTANAEDLLISEVKKAYQDASAEEMPLLIGMLNLTKLGKNQDGLREIVDFIIEQMEIESPFKVTDEDLVERLTVSVKQVTPYFSLQLNSNRYVRYFCDEIIPHIKKMQGFQDGTQNVVELLKLFGECSTFCTTLPSFEKSLTSLYDALIDLLPLPEETENESSNEPKLQFSYVECLLYSLHRLCRHYPDFFDDATRLKIFRKRLQYFARALQGYIKTLHSALQGKKREELRLQENKMKAVALRTTSNINVLIKDFFHSPPVYKSVIIPSWKMFRQELDKDSPSRKRKISLTSLDSESSKKTVKFDKIPTIQIYHPPNGKYSSLISQSSERGSRPRGGIRGGQASRGFFGRGRMKNINFQF